MDVSILVNSCDLYEDAWYPFLKLLKIQWNECPYDIFLNTENKTFLCDEFSNVKTICSGDLPWSDRVLNALEHIESEYILFFLEDQFLRSEVNTEWFDNCIDFIKNDKSIGAIFLRHTEKQVQEIKEDYFPRSEVTEKFPIVGMVALYRKEYLKALLKKGESPWDFESKGSMRSKEMPYKVLQYNKSRPALFVYDDKIEKGYGITQKKWLPKNKELFEKYHIEVDFDNLGFLDTDAYFEEKRLKAEEKKKLYQKLSVTEKLYLLKKKAFKK